MTTAVVDLFGAGTSGLHPVGERLALWFATTPAKVIARDFGVAIQTAKGWKRGQLPQMAHFAAMAARWGEDFLDFVFAPALADAPDLARRLERMEKRAAQFAAELADLKQQVTHGKMAVGAGECAGSGGGTDGAGAQRARLGRAAVSRTLGALLLLVFLAAPVLDVSAAMLAAPSQVSDLLDDDSDDGAVRLPKAPRLVRPVRGIRRGHGT